MDILIVMCIGIIIGHKLFPLSLKKLNEQLQVACTVLLIFSMGFMLGTREDIIHEFSTLGLHSFIFFLVPTLCSTICVFYLTKRFMTTDKVGN